MLRQQTQAHKEQRDGAKMPLCGNEETNWTEDEAVQKKTNKTWNVSEEVKSLKWEYGAMFKETESTKLSMMEQLEKENQWKHKKLQRL